jgi:uncharacterized protein with ParB-like and HNH nuclease domain
MNDIELEEIEREQALDNVEDEAEKDERVSPVQYEITSFGADYDAEGLVKRLQREDIYIPPFQRSFVWTQKEASRFIESLLLGLPVPGIFLARDPDTKRLLVIDGQQRLRSIQYFFEGYFDPDPESESKTVFKLLNVQKQFEGLTYDKLGKDDRIILNDSIIHATIVKQESPKGERSSIYHIFERLNTTGRKLSPQQIRVAIYHGRFLELLHSMNDYSTWRTIFGKKSKTLKDQELILRFLALYYNFRKYGEKDDTKTMRGFLNDFADKHRHCDKEFCEKCTALFQNTIGVAYQAFGAKAFRPERALNVAVYDSAMVGIAKRLEHKSIKDIKSVKTRYLELLKNTKYINDVSRATSNERSVKSRCTKAVDAFADI